MIIDAMKDAALAIITVASVATSPTQTDWCQMRVMDCDTSFPERAFRSMHV